MGKRLSSAVVIMGFSGLAAQMLLLRETLVAFSGHELSIGIILANWLVLEAAGSLLLGRRAPGPARAAEWFVALSLAFSLSLVLSLWSARMLRPVLGIAPGQGVGLPTIFWSTALVLLPASFFHGALFAFACRVASGHRREAASTAGSVYAWETAGTIAGGFAWTYLFIPFLDAFQAAALVVMLNLLAGPVLLGLPRGITARAFLSGLCLLLLPSVALAPAGFAGRVHRATVAAQWRPQEVVHYRNSVHGNITVVEREGQYTFFLDGRAALSTPVPDYAFVEQFVTLPLVAHPRPRDILVLSGGAGGVIGEILDHPGVRRVVYTELDPELIEVIRAFPTPLSERELGDPRVDSRPVDGRLFLAREKDRYDILLVGAGEPTDLQANRYFTREFFALARERLRDDGILVLSLPGSFAWAGPELAALNASIRLTLESEFPHVRVLPGEPENIFLASRDPALAALDRAVVEERLAARGLPFRPLPRYLERRIHPRWEEWFAEFTAGVSPGLNRDFRPLGLFHSSAHRNAVHSPPVAAVFRFLGRVPALLGVIGALGVLLGLAARLPARARARRSVTLCILTTGFAGMVFEISLIFAFQAVYGHVFSWLGLLVAAFMAGAAAGALEVGALLRRGRDARRLFMACEAGLVALALCLAPAIIHLGPLMSASAAAGFLRALFPVLAAAGGFLVGAQFPAANRIRLEAGEGSARAAGLLYGADLLGGWAGGISAALFLLPVLGLAGTCLTVAAAKALSASMFSLSPPGA